MAEEFTRYGTCQYLKYLRERKGFTFYGLEKASGVQRNIISNVEKGRVKPRRKTLERLAPALGVTIENMLANIDIFDYSDHMKKEEEK